MDSANADLTTFLDKDKPKAKANIIKYLRFFFISFGGRDRT